MAAEQKQKLEQQLWNIANTLRGKMDADDFRDYILGFIFYLEVYTFWWSIESSNHYSDKIKAF